MRTHLFIAITISALLVSCSSTQSPKRRKQTDDAVRVVVSAEPTISFDLVDVI